MPADHRDQPLRGPIDAIERLTGFRLDRRSLLKGAGVGTLALGSVPTLGSLFAGKALAADLIDFHIVAASTPGGKPIGPKVDLLIVGGGGTIHGSFHSVGGRWVHLVGTAAPPFDVFAHGTWKIKELVAWNQIGAALGFAAGVLDVVVTVNPVETGETLELPSSIVCNLEPAGLDTGRREGIYIPGTPVGDFQPLDPAIGATAFMLPEADMMM